MNIDETQFLPRGEHVVNLKWINQHAIRIPFAPGVYESSSAWVKIGNHGEITQAAEKDTSILQFLSAGGWIDPCHIDCGLSYMELKHAYMGKSAYKSNSIYMARFNDIASVTRDDIERAYEAISKALGKGGQRLVEYACTKPTDVKSGCHSEAGINVYRQAMELLLKASDDIWRIIQSERMKNEVA